MFDYTGKLEYYLPINKRGYVYIMTNKKDGVLYTGVTSNLTQRVTQHKLKTFKGFSSRYNTDKLVYYEIGSDIDIEYAIFREKEIKRMSRYEKIKLIETDNTDWHDLSPEIGVEI